MNKILNKVDKLAELRANLEVGKKAEAKLVAELKAMGLGQHEGAAHYVTVFEQAGADKVDWKAIAMKFNPSRQMIAGNTKTGSANIVLKLYGYPAMGAKAVAA